MIFLLILIALSDLVDLQARLNYKCELLKYSNLGAIFLLTLASIEDGYYKNHVVRMDFNLQVIFAPGNNIESILYTAEQIVEFFSQEFELLVIQENCEINVMRGYNYERQGFECYLNAQVLNCKLLSHCIT
jgi:hypothetical protein